MGRQGMCGSFGLRIDRYAAWFDGLSALVETGVKEAPDSSAIFGFRRKRADRIKLLWWDG
ncbi:IS66 family insertion sequence element accessory protein TnpB [Agrobacterium sp. FDAARGOS_525]|uniref:IS66 family insertion sequence element accessory protein TnpB n=1 Tax=Agrobacterium sp. FDAARGOS_525 TaxID=2420311 RepID=UPI001AECEEAE|nr:IS66 family insertion sequence element accessory protein TnpB [Agrobacterium sp. FDAARGOS_525]